MFCDPRRSARLGWVLALALLLVGGGPAHADGPSKDPRNWPTVSRLVMDRYEHAGQVFTLRVHAKPVDYFNCGYRKRRGQLAAFTLLGGPYETLTGYMPKELGVILARVLEQDPWAQITVQIRFDPEQLGEICPGQVDVLEWSRGWQYPPGSLTPGRPDTSLQPTPERLRIKSQRALWKELRKLDSPHIGQQIQLTAGARVSTDYVCAFKGATRSHFAVRIHDGRGRFLHSYLPRSPANKQLLDHIALHRDVTLAVQARVVKLAMSSYCRPQLEVISWTLPDRPQ